MVIVHSLTDYIPSSDNPITIEVKGILNPNRLVNSNTGIFRVGIIKIGSLSYQDYNGKVVVLEMISAPNWA